MAGSGHIFLGAAIKKREKIENSGKITNASLASFICLTTHPTEPNLRDIRRSIRMLYNKNGFQMYLRPRTYCKHLSWFAIGCHGNAQKFVYPATKKFKEIFLSIQANLVKLYYLQFFVCFVSVGRNNIFLKVDENWKSSFSLLYGRLIATLHT